MRFVLSFICAVSIGGVAFAQESATAPADLVYWASRFHSKKTTVDDMPCVREQSAIICRSRVEGHLLTLAFDDVNLGDPAADHLVKRCLGTANLGDPVCRFRVTITPEKILRQPVMIAEGSIIEVRLEAASGHVQPRIR